MIPARTRTWEEANQAHLMAAIAEVRADLERFIGRPVEPTPADSARPARDASAVMSTPSALEILSATFGLTGFERKLLLMCLGAELDSQFRSLFASAAGDRRHSLPTFSLALAAFADAHWSALSPGRPLRRWRLVEILAGETLSSSPLRIDEHILHFLTGIYSIDERLRTLTDPVTVEHKPSPSQQAVAEEVARIWSRTDTGTAWPCVQLSGCETGLKRVVAAAACQMLGLGLRRIAASAVPRLPSDLDSLARIWEREAALDRLVLLLEADEFDSSDAAGEAAVRRFVQTLRSPLLLSVREHRAMVERPQFWFELPKLSLAEQVDIWKEVLGAASTSINGTVERLVSHFSLSPSVIRTAAAQALERSELAEASHSGLASSLWNLCRVHARPRLEGLAQRLEPAACWDTLVLPERQKQLLAQIVLQVRHRSQVYESWGFATQGARGLGISALFAGPSGTGKTMAGEVLANELKLDLYRIDLSQVVSKYIGETEKNLRRVFDAAEEGAAILLFDEADALFGKRSEVKDSHDRYANIEVSYLLQRMEAYRGLAILTSNRCEAIDSAFLRRIRFVVEFPFPDAAQRAEIWRRVFPNQTPTADLRIDRLARLNAAGGQIRNIALSAAFLAANAGEPVCMAHLLTAARSEFGKLERPLTDSETAGWV
jgi:hypothetical protein